MGSGILPGLIHLQGESLHQSIWGFPFFVGSSPLYSCVLLFSLTLSLSGVGLSYVLSWPGRVGVVQGFGVLTVFSPIRVLFFPG